MKKIELNHSSFCEFLSENKQLVITIIYLDSRYLNDNLEKKPNFKWEINIEKSSNYNSLDNIPIINNEQVFIIHPKRLKATYQVLFEWDKYSLTAELTIKKRPEFDIDYLPKTNGILKKTFTNIA